MPVVPANSSTNAIGKGKPMTYCDECNQQAVQAIRIVTEQAFHYHCQEHSDYPKRSAISEEWQWHGTKGKWIEVKDSYGDDNSLRSSTQTFFIFRFSFFI